VATFSAQDRQHLLALLTPSWLSGLLAVAAGLFLTVGVLLAFSLNNSSIQQQLIAWQANKPQPTQTLTTPNQTLIENDHPTIKGSWPLIVVWSLIGLITYTIAASVMHTIGQAEELRESLDYVNAQPRSLLIVTAEHAAMRLMAAIILIGMVTLFIKESIPYGITAAHASAADVASLSGALDALLAFAVIALSIHLQAIFVRLALGRLRVFS
jgi:hypothetical protein